MEARRIEIRSDENQKSVRDPGVAKRCQIPSAAHVLKHERGRVVAKIQDAFDAQYPDGDLFGYGVQKCLALQGNSEIELEALDPLLLVRRP